MRESYSWSKPEDIPNLIARKTVDWSIFESGSTIPTEFHRDFDEVNGEKLRRGDSRLISLKYYGLVYPAQLVNIDRKAIKSDTYQIRYSNPILKEILISKFKFSHNYLKLARQKVRDERVKKVYEKVPEVQQEYIDFIATGVPYEYELRFHSFNEEVFNDEEYQHEIETIVEKAPKQFEDKPKSKLERIKTNRSAFKRDSLVGLNAIGDANYECEINSDHKDFISKVTNKNYVEAHHLIPMQFQSLFYNSLDVEANVVSLCVACHKKLHHALFSEKEELVAYLYEQRKDRLAKCGIHIKKETLLELYE